MKTMPKEAPPVLTVTMNPAIDEAVGLDCLRLGDKNRCAVDTLDPGGKGINASRVMQRLGCRTLALGFAGGVTGELLKTQLDRECVPHSFDEVTGLTRINVMIYERSSGRRTGLYLPGPPASPALLQSLEKRLTLVAPQSIVVLGGSLPPGLPDSSYRDLMSALRSRNIRWFVDTSGTALQRALSSAFLVKPNVEEAEELLGRRLRDDAAILEAADEIQNRGARYVVISNGENGAIGIGPEGAWKAVPPKVEARSTIGSGDSMVAGLAVAFNNGRPFTEGLRLGTAAGAATAMTPGTHLCEPGTVRSLEALVKLEALRTIKKQRERSGCHSRAHGVRAAG